jgi:hypothetical protein
MTDNSSGRREVVINWLLHYPGIACIIWGSVALFLTFYMGLYPIIAIVLLGVGFILVFAGYIARRGN